MRMRMHQGIQSRRMVNKCKRGTLDLVLVDEHVGGGLTQGDEAVITRDPRHGSREAGVHQGRDHAL